MIATVRTNSQHRKATRSTNALSVVVLAFVAAACGGDVPERADPTGTTAEAGADSESTIAPPTTAAAASTTAAGEEAPDATQPTFFNSLSYEVPGMEDVIVERVVYGSDPAVGELTIDLYLPAEQDRSGAAPAVVFVMGYPNDSAMVGGPLKDQEQYQSWGRLVAASGMVGAAYDTTDAADTENVIEHLRTHSAELGIDPDRIGLVAVSANVGTALSIAMQPEHDYLRAAVFYYGLMYGPNGEHRDTLNQICAEIKCYGAELDDYPAIRDDVPMLVAKAGYDREVLNETIDRFVEASGVAQASITFIDYTEGRHGFDTVDLSSRSAEIVAETLDFLLANLT